jgi:prepilin signal peptidase PulO-like enzyme (type II secretory pathway)
MSAAGVLWIGMLTHARRTGLPCLLALPATAGGLCVAAFHTYLESIGRLECPAGIFGWGTAPQQALAGILVLAGAIGIGATRGRREIHYGFLAVVVAIVVGVLLGWSAIRSAPPMPPVPAQRYESPPDVCRPPFRSP